jgi:hypothetical protein
MEKDLRLIGHEGKQSDHPGPFDRKSQLPLMFSAGSRNPAGQNLAPFGGVPAKRIGILVIDFKFLGAEFTNLLLKEDLSLTPATPIFPIPTAHSPIHLRIHGTVHSGTFVHIVSIVGHTYSP